MRAILNWQVREANYYSEIIYNHTYTFKNTLVILNSKGKYYKWIYLYLKPKTITKLAETVGRGRR